MDTLVDPSVLKNPAMRDILSFAQDMNMTDDQMEAAWPVILDAIKEEGVDALGEIIKLWQQGSTMPDEVYKNADNVQPLVNMLKASQPEMLKEIREKLFVDPKTTPGTTKKKFFF